MNPLNTIKGTIIGGFVIAIVIALLYSLSHQKGLNAMSLTVWLHVLAGITWIGLLYYFNFIQGPALAAAAADQGGPGGAGINKYVAPLALVWFRWGAVGTWVTGVGALYHLNLLGDAFTLGMLNHNVAGLWIGVGVCAGAWLAGKRPALLIPTSGLLVASWPLTSVNMAWGVPLLLLIPYRGDIGDAFWLMGPYKNTTEPLLDVLNIPHRVVSKTEDVSQAIVDALGSGLLRS